MRAKPTAPVFSIPKFVTVTVGNSALEVLSVDPVARTFVGRVYDPLGESDCTHGELLTKSLDDVWTPVELAPVLFRTVK